VRDGSGDSSDVPPVTSFPSAAASASPVAGFLRRFRPPREPRLVFFFCVAIGKLDGLDVVVEDAASLVGKRQKVRIERVLDGVAYATLIRRTRAVPEPLTAEAEAEKPTRKPPARKGAAAEAALVAGDGAESEEAGELELSEPAVEIESVEADEDETEAAEIAEGEEVATQKKKTRRGSRGGRKRRKKPATGEAEAAADGELETGGMSEESPEPSRTVTIHVPGDEIGRDGMQPVETAEVAASEVAASEVAVEESTTDADGVGGGEPKPKKKTRRGTRGGRKRRKPATTAMNGDGGDGAGPEAEAPGEEEPAPEEPRPTEVPEPVSSNGASDDWEYVPMSEWLDEIESR
jgi:hypothetical protein